MKMTQLLVLRDIQKRGSVDIRAISEPYRQRMIDLGMMEPPLVQVDADRVSLTDAGRQTLQECS